MSFDLSILVAGLILFGALGTPGLGASRQALAADPSGSPARNDRSRVADRGTEESEDVEPPIVRLPSKPAPAAGWPVMIMMHGRGSNASRFVGFADSITRAGIVAVVPNGPVEMSADRYGWHREMPRNELHLRKVLAAASLPSKIDRSRMMLGGFSQGAGIAIQLAAKDPAAYTAALAVSPVGAVTSVESDAARSAALYVIVGRGDNMSVSSARTAEGAWREAGWPVTVDIHSGGHGPPDDWASRLEEAARVLLRQMR